jgi:hypothetical protein
MRRKAAEDFTQMHAHRRLGADGQPALREDRVTYFDTSTGPGAEEPVLSLDEALARLIDEHPLYARPVVLCELRRLDERTAAPLLHVARSWVNRNKLEGLSKLAQWTGLDSEDVRAGLRGA